MSKGQYKPENPHNNCTKIKLALVSVSSVIRQTLSADWWSTPSPDDYSSKHEVSFCAHLGCAALVVLCFQFVNTTILCL